MEETCINDIKPLVDILHLRKEIQHCKSLPLIKKPTLAFTLSQYVDCILSFKEHKMNVIYKTISMTKFPYSLTC